MPKASHSVKPQSHANAACSRCFSGIRHEQRDVPGGSAKSQVYAHMRREHEHRRAAEILAFEMTYCHMLLAFENTALAVRRGCY